MAGRLVWVALAFWIIPVCSAQENANPAAPQEAKEVTVQAEKASKAAASVDAMADSLYSKLSAEKGNVFFSPYSIHAALTMTLAGARGETAQQMQTVLHTPNAQAAADGYSALAAHLKQARDASGFELNIANSLWGEQSVHFDDAFVTLLKERYGSGLNQVDFRKDAEASRSRINNWVSAETKDKIKDLIPAGMLTSDTMLVLVNAIYFKAAWQDPFTKELTKEGDFHVDAQQAVKAQMMRQTLTVGYVESEQMQALELPYSKGAMSMLIMLPRTNADLPAVQKRIEGGALDEIAKQLRPVRVQLTMPKFTMRYKADLSRQLPEMGMPLAFSRQADFSGMTEQEKLFISNVVHEAFVAVDEQGTEAAGATAVSMSRMSMPVGEPVVFTADHPFVFAIRDRQTGAILFMGRLSQP